MTAPRPVPPLTARQLALVATRYAIGAPDECWLWTGHINIYGYGVQSVRGEHGRAYVRAHNLIYTLRVGPIPEGLELDHLCRVKACVNPAHLEPVTPAENNRRKHAAHVGPYRGTPGPRLTHCKRGHEFTPENVYNGPKGRECRTCRREWRIANARKRAA